ncbi:MAG: exodeoxyribonuclease VII large subunit [Myxococcales bacterium]|nr:exodeoxyribonuclease VII large subunit [Myxococcales bacterium]
MKQGDLFAPADDAGGAAQRQENVLRAPPAPKPAPEPPAAPAKAILTVSELTRQIKSTLERGFHRVTVRGEISGFRGPHPRGHLYFSLKDEGACIDVKIWSSVAQRLKFRPKEGLAVIAEGSVDVYEPQGRYSLIVSRIEPEGVGALALAFEQLKERLAAEGLFGEKRKRPLRALPFLPRRIGVVTSVSGAALRDFLRVLHARHQRLPVLVCDARVQGEGAASEVVRALRWLSKTDVDVVVVTRGGGSVEDLWTFNEEAVARAIFDCPVPVVSAIGHEVDFTIADFVADYRAPTPSAAAEKLAPVLADLQHGLATARHRLRKAAERGILESRQRLGRLSSRLVDPRRALSQRRLALAERADQLGRALRRAISSRRQALGGLSDRMNRRRPQALLLARRQGLRALEQRLGSLARATLRAHTEELGASRARSRLVGAARRAIGEGRAQLGRLSGGLQAMSPLSVLARGYSIVFRRADGKVVRGAADVSPGEEIAVRLAASRVEGLEQCDRIEATVTAARKGR